MNKALVGALTFVVTVIIGVDVAGLAGAFGLPHYDAGAGAIKPSSTISAPPSKGPSAPKSHTPSPSQSPKPPASIPPAVPVPSGAIPTAPIGNGSNVTTIGDSVMVDAQPYLIQLLPGIYVDGKVSRQLIQASQTVSHLQAAGDLHRYVVIELGTNGPFSASQLTGLLQQIGPHHDFVLVNTSDPRSWETVVNQTIAQVASSYPHTIMVNWYQAAQKVPQDFWPDQVHLKPQGAQYYAKLIAQAVLKLQQEYPPKKGS